MTEFCEIGAYCAYDLCKQQTFTAFDCEYCQRNFCEHHRNPTDHECKHIPKNSQTFKAKTKRKFKCNFKGCKSKTILLIKCAKCSNGFCSKHRHCDTHKCPKYISENKKDDDGDSEQMEDERWKFVKTELCKNWNIKIMQSLQEQIIYEEFDFDDLMEDLSLFDVNENESSLMDFLIDEYKWKDSMALSFHKDIESAFSALEKQNNENRETQNITQVNVIQRIYNEVKTYADDDTVMFKTNKTVEILMSDGNDDQMQYELWQLLGANAMPLIKKLRNDRKRLCDEISKLDSNQ